MSSSTHSNFNTASYFHQTVVASKHSTASFPHTITPQTFQSFAATFAVNTLSIQTKMSAHTERQVSLSYCKCLAPTANLITISHQLSSLAPTTTGSQLDYSNVAQLSMIPTPDARAPFGASGTTRHAIDAVMNQGILPLASIFSSGVI